MNGEYLHSALWLWTLDKPVFVSGNLLNPSVMIHRGRRHKKTPTSDFCVAMKRYVEYET